MLVDKIYEYLTKKEKTINQALLEEVSKLSKYAFERQFMTADSDERNLRLSSCGKCPRQLAYYTLGFEKNGREIDSRGRLIFWTGDLSELTIVSLAKASGCQVLATGLNQLQVKLTLGNRNIIGHPDGLILHDGITILLEVKSMSSYSFDDFLKGNIDYSYKCQINAYMKSLNLTMCLVVAINKDNGLLHEMLVYFDKEIYAQIEKNLETVINATKENLPERPYKPNEKGLYPWMCAYCAFYGTCLIEPKIAEKVMINNSTKLRAIKETKDDKTIVEPRARPKTVRAS